MATAESHSPVCPRAGESAHSAPGPSRILLDPTDDGWRATIYTPNGEITFDAPTFREAATAAVDAENAFVAR